MPTQYAFIAYDPDSSVYTIQPGATTSSIQSVINTAPPGAVLSFTAGTHTITDTLEIRRGDITIQGAGAGKTVFAFDMDSPGHGIYVDSSYKSWSGALTQDAAEGATAIKLASTAGLKAGDVLHIQQANTDSFLNANSYENVVGTSYQDKLPINETLVEIASVSGNTVTLKTPVTHDMDASVTTIKSVNMLYDIKLSGFSVTYPSLGGTDPDRIANTQPDYQGKIAIFINKTYGTEVSDVAVKDAPGHSMEFRTTLMPHVNGFTADGAHNKGDTGDGYGIQLSETYYGTFENLTLVNMRHAFVFSAWHTEVGNKVHIVTTNRDINFHGGPDYDNVVLVDSDLYREGDTTWRLVSPGGNQHPYTDIDANTVLFKVASGGSKYDVIHGSNDGAWLSGNVGKDELYGGASDDILIGGVENDTLTGGGGRDIFAMHSGDGRDDIKDFQTGPGGDFLLLQGYSNIDSFSDLILTQTSSGTRVTAAGQDVANLLGVDKADLAAGNFMFNAPDIFKPPVSMPPTGGGGSDKPDLPPPPVIAGLTASLTKNADKITGAEGDDVVSAMKSYLSASDVVNLGAGHDTFKLLNSSASLDLRSYTKLSGIDSIDISGMTGTAKVILGDTLLAGSDHHAITIRYGSAPQASVDTSYLNHSLYDVYVEGTGVVTLSGRSDSVMVAAGSKGNVHGAGGNDVLYGNDGMDLLYGDGGNDVLYGGRGADTLAGGSSSDTFVYRSALEGGDIITDFTSGDKFDLTELLAANGLGNLSAAQALSGGYVKTVASGNDVIVSFDKDGVGPQAAVALATLKDAADDHITFAAALIA